MSQELESKMNQMRPIMRMLIPAVGGKEGLKKILSSNMPSIKEGMKDFLNAQKEKHKEVFEEGGYQAISLSLVCFSNNLGIMVFALKFKKGTDVPEITKPLEIIEIDDYFKRLVDNIPLDEMAKDL
ncbi:hypothetical protein [Aureispira sp. CCB-QB1]|uniref:hypothetical protein n=1 Tax=Aureispira sp. CCB-QB1 TaxID=1313421 RepID=UPI000698A23F|nr:hypothetical protein [Aureispira sp. CCB-QB1]